MFIVFIYLEKGKICNPKICRTLNITKERNSTILWLECSTMEHVVIETAYCMEKAGMIKYVGLINGKVVPINMLEKALRQNMHISSLYLKKFHAKIYNQSFLKTFITKYKIKHLKYWPRKNVIYVELEKEIGIKDIIMHNMKILKPYEIPPSLN